MKVFMQSKTFISLYKAVFRIGSLLPKKKHLIVFESFSGKQCSDNPRAIFEYLKENHPEFELVWSFHPRHLPELKQQNVPFVKRFSLSWFVAMCRAKYWVSNTRFPDWFVKSKRTVYLQTWHGTPLKKLGLDIEDIKIPSATTDQYKRGFLKESAKWDYLISPNAYSSEIFKRAFGFQGKMLETGYPRNDFLIRQNRPETIHSIKESLGLPEHKKILLYAPTWRDDQYNENGEYQFRLQLDLEKMQRVIGKEYMLLLRFHPLVSEKVDVSPFSDFAIDVSGHSDIRDLYVISDVLITDYSSVFFDFSILNRPMLFFTYDIENYRDHLRGFYFDFERDAPGPLLKTTEEIVQKLLTLKEDDTDFESFRRRFHALEDGNAARRVVEDVFLGR